MKEIGVAFYLQVVCTIENRSTAPKAANLIPYVHLPVSQGRTLTGICSSWIKYPDLIVQQQNNISKQNVSLLFIIGARQVLLERILISKQILLMRHNVKGFPRGE